ncbi:hypothetical protein ACFLSF_03695 [Candidatus Bipolaricaulota bacterium]
METKQESTTLSIYIPRRKAEERLWERLSRLGEERDRSVNYLVIEAISEYLDRAEKKDQKKR